LHRTAELIRCGDGRSVWTEGEVQASVDFGVITLPLTFAVLQTSAFSTLLGITFHREREVLAFSFTPTRLLLKSSKTTETLELHLLTGEEDRRNVALQ